MRPGGLRLRLLQMDLDDALDALEAVLPGNHQPDGRAVLIRQGFAVDPHRQERERVHRLVDAQPFEIREGDGVEAAHPCHVLGLQRGLEGDVLRP